MRHLRPTRHDKATPFGLKVYDRVAIRRRERFPQHSLVADVPCRGDRHDDPIVVDQLECQRSARAALGATGNVVFDKRQSPATVGSEKM